MKANEFRSGNIVKGNTFNIPREGISSDGTMILTAYGIYMIESGKLKVEPIKLTNAWLIKSGLKKGISVHNDRFRGIVKVVKASYIQSFELYIGNVHIKNVDYIHDVQNLFYELTDTELEIK